MRILMLNPMIYSGDGKTLLRVKTIKETMSYGMCLGFKALGHEVTMVTYEDYIPTEAENYDFEIVFLKSDIRALLVRGIPISFELFGYLRKNGANYDMILASECFAFHTLWAAILYPQKTVIWHELVAHTRKFFSIPSHIWYSIVMPLFFRKVKVAIGRSEKAINFLKHTTNLPVSDIFVDHGINIENFRVSEAKKRQFIVIAQLVERKNVKYIIDQFEQLIKFDGYGDLKLYIAGRGPQEKELHQYIVDKNLIDSVSLLGFVRCDVLNKYVSESLAALVATKNDLNMVSISECIASGTPIVTNMLPALVPYIIRKGLGIAKDGWGAHELKTIIDDNEAYAQRCRLEREGMSISSSAQKIIDIFNNI